jgi:hypothetical protein
MYLLGYDEDSFIEYYAIENENGFTYMTYDVNTLKQRFEKPIYPFIEWKEVSREKMQKVLHGDNFKELEWFAS